MEDAKHLEKLLAYKDDEQVLQTLREIKMHSKQNVGRLSEADTACGD